MTEKKLYSFAEVTLIQWKARLNELRRLNEDIERKMSETAQMCTHWQKQVNEERNNET